MLIKLLAHPFFWIGIYLFGYSITIVVLSLGAMQKKVESRSPKPLVRIFILTTFIAPPLILPFTKGPKMVIPSPFTLTVEILHKVSLRENFHIRKRSNLSVVTKEYFVSTNDFFISFLS